MATTSKISLSPGLISKIDRGKAQLMSQMILEGTPGLPWSEVPPEVSWMAMEEACKETFSYMVEHPRGVTWYRDHKLKSTHMVDEAERILVEAWKIGENTAEITADIYRSVGERILDALADHDRGSAVAWVQEANASAQWKEKMAKIVPTEVLAVLRNDATGKSFKPSEGPMRELLEDLAHAAAAGVPVPRLIAEGAVQLDKAYKEGKLNEKQVQKAIELAVKRSPSIMKKSLLQNLIKSTPLEGREL